MKITRENYEAYLLDQLEGKISDADRSELREFLFQNPDCAQTEEGPFWSLEATSISFPEKHSLKKEIPGPQTVVSSSNFDMISIARLENDLSRQQIAGHEQLVQSDVSLQKEWEQWQLTRLPDSKVIYPRKDELKRKVPARSRMLWISGIAAAASLALFLTVFTSRDPESSDMPAAGT